MDYNSHLDSIYFILFSGVLLTPLSILIYEFFGCKKISLLVLIVGSFLIGFYAISADPFLHMWDEQFHAVVAKNMTLDPFNPKLIQNPLVDFNYKNWASNHIWLHKQPFFLWQIAISFKLFGFTTIALRIPSLLMIVLMVIPIYRIGKIINSERAGVIAAFLFVGMNFIWSLISGRINTDHNDVAFLFYVTLSIWAYFESLQSENKMWIILVGVFVGIAVLNKWLVGLLAFSIWGLDILTSNKRVVLNEWLKILTSFIISVLVFLPWQLYILYKYPKESIYEYSYNSKHLFDFVENHGGDYLFHFHNFSELFGTDFIYVLVIGLVFFIFSKISFRLKLLLIFPIIFVYLFFSVVATKMPAFPIIVAPLAFILVSIGLVELFKLISKIDFFSKHPIIQKLLFSIITIFIFIHFLNYDGINLKNKKSFVRTYSKAYLRMKTYEDIAEMVNDSNTIFYNPRKFDNAKLLFLTSADARNGLPKREDIEMLKERKSTIYVFDDGKLPTYITNDSYVYKIKSNIWDYSYSDKIRIFR